MRRAGQCFAGLLLLGAPAWSTAPATAAFPGRNGELAWGFSHGVSCEPGGCRGTVEIKGLDMTSKRQRVLACDARHPRFSPNGRRLAFSRASVGIFVKQVVAPSRATPVAGTEQSYAATWAPDSRRLAFHTFAAQHGLDADIYTARIDGTRRRRITFGGRSYQPVWGPDGRIAFSWAGRKPGVFVINSDGSGRRRVTLTAHAGDDASGGTSEAPESWSPDGRRIAFVRHRRDDRNRIYVVNADGSGLHRVAAGFAFAAWAPNGKRIAIAHARFNRRINTVRPDGSDRRLLTAESREGSVRCHNEDASNIADEIGFSGLDWQPLPSGR